MSIDRDVLKTKLIAGIPSTLAFLVMAVAMWALIGSTRAEREEEARKKAAAFDLAEAVVCDTCDVPSMSLLRRDEDAKSLTLWCDDCGTVLDYVSVNERLYFQWRVPKNAAKTGE